MSTFINTISCILVTLFIFANSVVEQVQVGQVVRLAGQHSDADSCGTLVWAQAEEEVWWPAEALDPHHLPPGRLIPATAIAGKTANAEALPGYIVMQTECVAYWACRQLMTCRMKTEIQA